MVEKDAVSKDFRKQVLGYGLTTAEIVYRRPDRHWLLQTYVWQDYDLFPNFPALKDFRAFWETKLEGPLFAVTVAHCFREIYSLHAGQFSEITIPHFLFAGADEVIE
jgi:uncharacterized protein Usg